MVKPKPGPVRELFNRAPILLYRAHLGWALGSNLLLLTMTGRKTSRTRRTVVEVVKSSTNAEGAATVWVIASRGRYSDWYANVIAGGLTRITWMSHSFTPRIHALNADERFDLLVDYQRRHARAAPCSARLPSARGSRALMTSYDGSLRTCAHFGSNPLRPDDRLITGPQHIEIAGGYPRGSGAKPKSATVPLRVRSSRAAGGSRPSTITDEHSRWREQIVMLRASDEAAPPRTPSTRSS